MGGGVIRLIVWAGVVIGWGSLALQFWLTVVQAEPGKSALMAWRYVGYFTILSNAFAAAVLTNWALWPDKGGGLASKRSGLAMVTAMTLVGITYSLLLRGTWQPQGLFLVADHLLHDLMPVLVIVVWLLRPHGALRWGDVAWVLVWPLIYAVYAFGRGAMDGWYPYFFIDVNQLSFALLARNVMGMLVLLCVIGLAFIGLDRVMARRGGEG